MQPPSSDKVKETDDDFAIVRELSEDDPYFDKKKVRNGIIDCLGALFYSSLIFME